MSLLVIVIKYFLCFCVHAQARYMVVGLCVCVCVCICHLDSSSIGENHEMQVTEYGLYVYE